MLFQLLNQSVDESIDAAAISKSVVETSTQSGDGTESNAMDTEETKVGEQPFGNVDNRVSIGFDTDRPLGSCFEVIKIAAELIANSCYRIGDNTVSQTPIAWDIDNDDGGVMQMNAVASESNHNIVSGFSINATGSISMQALALSESLHICSNAMQLLIQALMQMVARSVADRTKEFTSAGTLLCILE
jgi:hypothetical protein